MRKKIVFPVFAILLAASAVSWFEVRSHRDIPQSSRVDHVERIFLCEETQYIVLAKDPSSNKIIPSRYQVHKPEDVVMLPDVPNDKEMWLSASHSRASGEGFVKKLEIHIHSVKNIEAGAWNRTFYDENSDRYKTVTGKNSLIE